MMPMPMPQPESQVVQVDVNALVEKFSQRLAQQVAATLIAESRAEVAEQEVAMLRQQVAQQQEVGDE